MQSEHIVWRLTPTEWTAIGTVVNAGVVIVLAVINIFYLRSARRQADAATKQADAARGQAEAASQSIRLLQAQMDDQARLNLIQTVTDLRAMHVALADLPRILRHDWGTLPKSVRLLPAHWASMVHVIEKNAPDERPRLSVIETTLLAANEKLKVELARDANYRSQQGLLEAADIIERALDPLLRVLIGLERLTSAAAK
jgi:hypothetical protein